MERRVGILRVMTVGLCVLRAAAPHAQQPTRQTIPDVQKLGPQVGAIAKEVVRDFCGKQIVLLKGKALIVGCLDEIETSSFALFISAASGSYGRTRQPIQQLSPAPEGGKSGRRFPQSEARPVITMSASCVDESRDYAGT